MDGDDDEGEDKSMDLLAVGDRGGRPEDGLLMPVPRPGLANPDLEREGDDVDVGDEMADDEDEDEDEEKANTCEIGGGGGLAFSIFSGEVQACTKALSLT